MGGHGGLNILPQKRWNVYNFENREKVRKDEEEAAREEEVKRDESRKRNFDIRIQQLRQARGIHSAPEVVESTPESKSKHINLLEGIKIFDPVEGEGEEDEKRKKQVKKMKKEEVRVVGPEDEKYRLGYGVAGKGVKAPWYATRPAKEPMEEEQEQAESAPVRKTKMTSNKKTVEELREERIKREKAEKERTRALLLQKQKQKQKRRLTNCF